MARGVGGLGEDELRPVISTPDQRHSKRPHAACHSADGTRCAKVTISLGWRFAFLVVRHADGRLIDTAPQVL
jgi:hypothetical protein